MNKTSTKSQSILPLLTVAVVLGCAVSAPSLAFATTFSDIATNLIKGQLSSLPDLVSAVCYVSGVTAMTGGVMKLKDHADNPQNKLTPALGRLATGGALVSLPVVSSVVLKTLSLTSSASEGQTFQGFGVGTIS